MDWKKIKRTLKKVWYFIWEDDSWASWFFNIIFAFILIKFLVYPGLGFALSTSHPIVAVVSSSMEHEESSFDAWWASHAMCNQKSCTQQEFYDDFDISKEEFRDFRFRNGFNRGDIMILYGADPENIDAGDVIVFKANRPDPVIHRVITTSEKDLHYSFMTKGDNNDASFYFESYIPEENYIGKAVVRIPMLGYIKIGFVKLLELIGIL